MTLKRILFRHLIVTLVADPDPDPTFHFDAGVYILVKNGYLFPPPSPLGNLYFFPKKTA